VWYSSGTASGVGFILSTKPVRPSLLGREGIINSGVPELRDGPSSHFGPDPMNLLLVLMVLAIADIHATSATRDVTLV
jgi:hypothetical protein